MGTSLIYIVIGLIVFIGLRTILRDWRKQFEVEDKEKAEQHKKRLERNRQEAKTPGVVTLKRGDDGVYRPGDE
jgi:flagellar biosynthesis/type III secretory pathway M-ring protein FliF/YscJ